MLQARGRGGRQPSHSRHLHHATHAPHHATHAPHHTAHAAHQPAHGPRNVASRGRDAPAAAANAAPRQGNAAPSGMRNTGIAPQPLSSYHNRQSSAQMQKSTWPVNDVPHVPSAAGDGHHPRKPAVHAGVPRAKKLPAADRNISVRCTWTNNVASEVQRTVSVTSSNQRSATAQPQYRAPSPPGSASTTDTSCPEDLRKKLQRLRMCDPQVLMVFLFTSGPKNWSIF